MPTPPPVPRWPAASCRQTEDRLSPVKFAAECSFIIWAATSCPGPWSPGEEATVGDLPFVVGLDQHAAGQPQQRGVVRRAATATTADDIAELRARHHAPPAFPLHVHPARTSMSAGTHPHPAGPPGEFSVTAPAASVVRGRGPLPGWGRSAVEVGVEEGADLGKGLVGLGCERFEELGVTLPFEDL